MRRVGIRKKGGGEMKFPVSLEGQRVIVQAMDETHKEELLACGNHPDIWTYLPNAMNGIEDMSAFVDSALQGKQSGLEFPFVVYDKVLEKLVGSTRYLNVSASNRNVEIGYTWYSPEVWRTRINTECKYLLLKCCFEALGMVRVQFKADVRNDRSNAAILRIGAVKEGVLRQDRILPDGHRRNANVYSIIDSEWPAVKERLENYLRTRSG